MSFFLDTNVLLYAIGLNPAELAKRGIARSLLARDEGVVSVQVFQEFVSQATRTSRDPRLTIEQAWRFVAVWRRLKVQDNSMALLDNAYTIYVRQRFSWWDRLIVAGAQAQGCSILYTEDMQDGRIVDGLRIVNPFREGAVLP